jgi:transcriptional regulator with XRE-family HTH domain
MLGVSHTHILRMEKGEKGPSANLVLKMSQLFNVSADRLLRDDLELDD